MTDWSNCDWTECDLSPISETSFPVRCDRCAHHLLGDTGSCPNCGEPFSRRRRLWETYGPEAFALPDTAAADPVPDRFVRVLLTVLIAVLLMPIVVSIYKSLFGTVDVLYTLIAWAVVATSAGWIVLARLDATTDSTADADP